MKEQIKAVLDVFLTGGVNCYCNGVKKVRN